MTQHSHRLGHNISRKTMTTRKVAVIVLDGMTPFMLSPDVTPRLFRFGQENCLGEKALSIFPSETRIAVSSLATGCWPNRHGNPSNYFFLRSHAIKINTADITHLRQAEQAWGRMLAVPDLGEILAGHHKTMTTISGGSVGNCALLNWNAARWGHKRYCLWNVAGCDSPESYDAMLEQYGPVPTSRTEAGFLSQDTLDYLERIIFDHLQSPDPSNVVIAWLPNPDDTAHAAGLFGPELVHSLGQMDAICGRVIDWWEAEGKQNGWQILFTSDHGHAPVGERVQLHETIDQAGFSVAMQQNDLADPTFLLHPASSAHLTMTQPNHRQAEQMLHWLMEQPWCGNILVNPLTGIAMPGVFSTADVMSDHPHGPDIYFTINSVADTSVGAFPTKCGSYMEHGCLSSHGGLLPTEMETIFLAGGNAFKQAHRSSVPMGIVDIAPSILHLLGLPPAPSMQGRIIKEFLYDQSPNFPQANIREEVLKTGRNDYAQELIRLHVDDVCYVARARRIIESS